MTITHPAQDGPVLARAAALWLATESAARRLDPITEVYASLDEVQLVVCPTALDVWETWTNLLQVDAGSVKWGRGMVNAVGTWAGVVVRLRGLDTERWSS